MNYIKLMRSLKNKSYYSKDSEKLHLWVHLLLTANWNDREEMLGGKPIICKAGQFTTGRKQLSKETGINESKVERLLTYFEKTEQQIEQRKTNTNRLISVLNWDKYQINEQPIKQRVNNKRTTSEQRVNTPKEYKEYKEYKEDEEETKNIEPLNNKDIGDEIIIPEKTWKNDFEVYKENVRNGYREIMEDEAWFKKQSEFYPNVNILKSIEKSCVNFWITEAGWKNKKKTKTETINWKLTFANAISQPQNKVYYDRNSDPKQTGDNKNRIYSGGNNAEQRRASVENLTRLAEAILQQP